MVKNLPARQETWVLSLGWEDPLKEGMATHSSILAWRIHGQRNPAGYSPWGRKELAQLSDLTCMYVGNSLGHQLGVLPFNGILTPSAWR